MGTPHATIAQVRKGRDGRMVLIEDDVLDIAKQIGALHPSLGVRWSESGEHFAVYQQLENGDENLVTTSLVLDGRLVDEVRRAMRPSEDLAARVERVEAEKQREFDRAQHERIGEAGERLAHAIRKDMQFKHRAFIPRDPEAA